jgi:protein gp37
VSDNTKIEWTDATVNAVNGCSVVSPGCTNCYAMRLAGTRLKHSASRSGLTIDTKAGPVWNGITRLNETALMQPLRWKRPRRIFWNAHGDLFHDSVPDEWIDRCFAVMALTPQHIHQVLTKRPERMRAYLSDDATIGRIANAVQPLRTDRRPVGPLPHLNGGERWWPLPNVWLGTSVEDQSRADERIPHLLATPAAVRFLSCEPLLGPIDLGQPIEGLPANHWFTWLDKLDWVIVGGESGPGARPMHPDWARLIRDQCAATEVAFFLKQWGEWADMATAGGRRASDRRERQCSRLDAAPSDVWRREPAHRHGSHLDRARDAADVPGRQACRRPPPRRHRALGHASPDLTTITFVARSRGAVVFSDFRGGFPCPYRRNFWTSCARARRCRRWLAPRSS